MKSGRPLSTGPGTQSLGPLEHTPSPAAGSSLGFEVLMNHPVSFQRRQTAVVKLKGRYEFFLFYFLAILLGANCFASVPQFPCL
jgi:hypothetical protein